MCLLRACQSMYAVQVRWHRSLETVSGDSPAIYLAHEFFDALPVHQFQRTDRCFSRLLDVTPEHLHISKIAAIVQLIKSGL